jgi:hypothetical protein
LELKRGKELTDDLDEEDSLLLRDHPHTEPEPDHVAVGLFALRGSARLRV